MFSLSLPVQTTPIARPSLSMIGEPDISPTSHAPAATASTIRPAPTTTSPTPLAGCQERRVRPGNQQSLGQNFLLVTAATAGAPRGLKFFWSQGYLGFKK